MSDLSVMPDASSSAKPTKKLVDAILSLMRSRLDTCISVVSDSRDDQLDDLKFAAGSPDNQWQWPTYATASRIGADGTIQRPCLTINKLMPHVRQVTNEQRQNRISGEVIPANDAASDDVVEIIEGMIRHIEYTSNADIAYDTAGENQTIHGEGYYRIITEYESDDSFNQIIKIKRIRNSFSVYLDDTCQDPCGEDAQWGLISENLSKLEYENKYPDSSPISSLTNLGVGNESTSPWFGEDMVRIAEYFYFETTKTTLNLYPDDNTAFEGSVEDGVYRKHLGDPIKSRRSDRKQVKWIKTNGYEILEQSDWVGDHIPIIRVIGNEFEVEGQLCISGLVRNAKDAQRMYNYHASNEVEMIALAPKAPFIGAAGQFENFEKQWKTANTTPWPYLEYNAVVDEGGNTLGAPQRAQPPMVQSGIIAAKNSASEDIKEVTGQYNASLGQPSNERSGAAINARTNEGDVSTFHYPDNLARAIRYGTKQIVTMIPRIYDTKRVVNILGEDRKPGMVQLDPSQPVAMKEIKNDAGTTVKKIYNLSIGKYDIMVVTGPSYATKRREETAIMGRLLESNPELMNKIGDLFFKNMDWGGSQEIADRLARGIPPQLMDNSDNPALQQAQQQIQGLQKQLQQAHGMLQNIQNSMEARELGMKQQEMQIKMFDAETKRIAATAQIVNGATRDAGVQTLGQVQDVVVGTLRAAQDSGHIGGDIPTPSMQQPSQGPPEPQEQTPPLDPNKVMVEGSKHILQANQHDHEMQMAQLAAAQQQPQGEQ